MMKNKGFKKINKVNKISSSSVRAAAVACLARRPYTAFELKQKLTQKGVAHETAVTVVDSLVFEGLLDEERLVEAVIFERKNYTLKGRSFVLLELQRRGVNKDLIETGLASHYTDEEETSALIRYLQKESAFLNTNDQKEKQKKLYSLMRRAAGRGFPSAKIYALFAEEKINFLDNELGK